jgi:hypothetical protein
MIQIKLGRSILGPSETDVAFSALCPDCAMISHRWLQLGPFASSQRDKFFQNVSLPARHCWSSRTPGWPVPSDVYLRPWAS